MATATSPKHGSYWREDPTPAAHPGKHSCALYNRPCYNTRPNIWDICTLEARPLCYKYCSPREEEAALRVIVAAGLVVAFDHAAAAAAAAALVDCCDAGVVACALPVAAMDVPAGVQAW